MSGSMLLMRKGMSRQQVADALSDPSSEVGLAGDERWALTPERIWISVPRLTSISATATPVNIGNWAAYSMSSAAVQQIGVEVDFPSTWNSYRPSLYWTVLTAVAGSAAFIFAYGHWAEGDSYNSLAPSTQTASALFVAPSQYALKISQLSPEIAVNPNGPNLLRILRNAPDSLAAAVGVIGLMLERVS